MKMVTGKIIYVSAPMTGIKNLNKEAFEFAAGILSSLGAKAILLPTILPPGLEYDDYMHIDCAMIDVADIIVVVGEWTKSNGCPLELDRALLEGKEIIHLQHILNQLEAARR